MEGKLNNYSKSIIISGLSITLICLYYGDFTVVDSIIFIGSMLILIYISIPVLELNLSPLKDLDKRKINKK